MEDQKDGETEGNAEEGDTDNATPKSGAGTDKKGTNNSLTYYYPGKFPH